MMPSSELDPGTAALIAAVRGQPHAMLNLAKTLLMAKGKFDHMRALADEAAALAPGDPEIAALARPMQGHDVGSWYFTMVQDEARHALYAEAFRKVFTPGCTVLDIGAGTGLFAMLAAREGAGRVIGCEWRQIVAETASRIVEANGFADRVTILAKDSKAIEIGVDLDERADVLLWDNLANNLLGAGGNQTVEDARRRLVKPGAPVMPVRAEIMVALVTDAAVADRMMGEVDGFDMTAFNTLRPTNFTIDRPMFPVISSNAAMFDIRFDSDEPLAGEKNEVTVTAEPGTVYGIAQWVRFHIVDGIVYDTSGKTVTAFGTQFYAVEPFDSRAGQQVRIGGRHDTLATWFWIADDGAGT